MNFREAISLGDRLLKAHRCDGASKFAQQESEALLALAAGVSREMIFALFTQELKPVQERKFRALIDRRLKHVPLAWLLGSAPFMGRDFYVTRDTLIPRPATESVVEAALNAARESAAAGAPVTDAVDVGTGSGCIAVSLALALPQAVVWATDSSIPALSASRHNFRRYGIFVDAGKAKMGVAGKITMRKMNLLGYEPTPEHVSKRPIPLQKTGAALIVANLPYVPSTMRAKMSACVLREPASALFSGPDGLIASRALVRQLAQMATKHPNKKIIVASEILAKQFVPLAKELHRTLGDALTAAPKRIVNLQGTTVGLLAVIGPVSESA